jgi:hypothetical protein
MCKKIVDLDELARVGDTRAGFAAARGVVTLMTVEPLPKYGGIFQDSVLLTIDPDEASGTKHSILIEWDDAAWFKVRDACDRSRNCDSLSEALKDFIAKSERANRGAPGHSVWMMEVGLPLMKDDVSGLAMMIMASFYNAMEREARS